jgi:hypothetical protein
MSIYDDIKKAFQDLLAPEIQEIRGELKAINIRLDGMEKLAEVRFAAIMRELAIDKRLERLERGSEEKAGAN